IESIRKKDDLYESAIEVVVREGRGSISLIQRCLGIGYGRAARLMDYMEEDGIVGTYNGQKSREVLIDAAQWAQMQGLQPGDEEFPEEEESQSDSVDDHGDEEEYEDYE
ncbi:MAG: DNA translocase FtsK, partial [Planctomycetota bacterium]